MTDTTTAGRPAREALSVDLCIIGGGPGGLAVATAAAAFGQKVVLVEKQRLGGADLYAGSVPSKALLAAARRAQAMRTAVVFGVAPVDPGINFAAVHAHVHGVIAAIAPNVSVERLSGLGVRVIQAVGRFADKRTVIAGEYDIAARRVIIATGSSPLRPPIPGLESVPHFTTDTIFDNLERIPHLVVIGSDPRGLELAQAHLRLGSRVTVIEGTRALAESDAELTAPLLRQLRSEGLEIIEGATIERVEGSKTSVRVHYKTAEGTAAADGTHLLVVAGRRPNVADLGLDAAGIELDKGAIAVDQGLRTSNRRVFAIGDVAGGRPSADAAEEHAAIVLRRFLFRWPSKARSACMPHVVYTQPELAHVGLSEDQVRERKVKPKVLRWPFNENVRAQTDRVPEGHIKVVTDAKGRVLGATIVGESAGELIHPWSLAVSKGLSARALAGSVAPTPTLGEIGKRAALRYFTSVPANPVVRHLIRLTARLG